MFAFCKLFFCHDSLENVAGINAFKWFAFQLSNKEYIITIFEICPISGYQLISEHFLVKTVILLQTVANDGALSFVHFFWITL